MLNERVIDADAHICEPGDVWTKYLEPKYRDRALRLEVGEGDVEYFLIDGKPSQILTPPVLVTLGAMGDDRVAMMQQARQEMLRGERRQEEMGHLLAVPPGTRYAEVQGYGTMDAKERLHLLDREGVDKAIIYPSLGLAWQAELFDPELSDAYCRAYNRWIVDFCSETGGRLVPAAVIDLAYPETAAIELERAVADGCKTACVVPFTSTRVPHGHPAHDRVFAAAQDLDIPLGIHPTFDPKGWGVHNRFDNMDWAMWYMDLFGGQPVQHAFATLFQFGVFDRFPKFRCVVLESQAGWIGAFLDRGDAVFEHTAFSDAMIKEKPSFYFKRQCFISADPDERSLGGLMEYLGEDKFFWASDYAHPDHPGQYMQQLETMVEKMPASARRAILADNVAREYCLD